MKVAQVAKSPASMFFKARVRKAYKLYFEISNRASPADTRGLSDLQSQMATLAAAVAQGVLKQPVPALTAPETQGAAKHSCMSETQTEGAGRSSERRGV